MTLQARIYRSMISMAAIAMAGSTMARAQYTFVKITIPGAATAQATGISNKNEIVGSYTVGTTGNASTYGFWRTNDQPALLIYPLVDNQADSNAPLTVATSINSGRDVVGYFAALNNVYTGMFLNGGEYQPWNVPGCQSTFVNGINDNGETAGTCELITDGFETTKAWVSTRTWGLMQYAGLWGAELTYANAINKKDQVVGYFLDPGTSTYFGFLDLGGGNLSAFKFPGSVNTMFAGINDSSAISGYYADSSGRYHGMVYANGTWATVDVPGAFETFIYQINNHGWLAGQYVNRLGQSNAFFAKPSSTASVLVEQK